MATHPPAPPPTPDPAGPLRLVEMRRQLQGLLTPTSDLIIETGDAWFNGQRLVLPDGARCFSQMQYGSIGWATGAALGLSLATKGSVPARRTVALIGDGAFQMSAQAVSTMIRQRVDPILFILNNRGYTIEVQIHDGPYNNIQNWRYSDLIHVFNDAGHPGLGLCATTALQLSAAIEQARAHDGVVVIECQLDRDDCTPELITWGQRVAAANARTSASQVPASRV